MARYRSLVEARSAIRKLEAKGVDGDDLSLVGDAANADRTTICQNVDRRIQSSLALSALVGVVLGALCGAALGAVAVAIVVFAWPDMTAAGWVSGVMIGWFAAAGALFGALSSVTRTLGSSTRTLGSSDGMPSTWENDAEEPVWLAVYGDSDDLRPDVEGTHPVVIVDDPETAAQLEDTVAG